MRFCRPLPVVAARPSFWGVLHLAITKRPVLAAGIDEADPYVLLAHALLSVDLVSDMLIESLFHLGRASADPGDLDDDQVRRVVDAEIALFRIDDLVRLMASDNLESIVLRDVRDRDHRIIHGVAYVADPFA